MRSAATGTTRFALLQNASAVKTCRSKYERVSTRQQKMPYTIQTRSQTARPAEVRGGVGQAARLPRIGPRAEVDVDRPREKQHRPDRVAGIGDGMCPLADQEADGPR